MRNARSSDINSKKLIVVWSRVSDALLCHICVVFRVIHLNDICAVVLLIVDVKCMLV